MHINKQNLSLNFYYVKSCMVSEDEGVTKCKTAKDVMVNHNLPLTTLLLNLPGRQDIKVKSGGSLLLIC